MTSLIIDLNVVLIIDLSTLTASTLCTGDSFTYCDSCTVADDSGKIVVGHTFYASKLEALSMTIIY